MSDLEHHNQMLEIQKRQNTHESVIRTIDGMQMLQQMQKKQHEERRQRKLHAPPPAVTTGQPLTPSPSGPARIPRKDSETVEMEVRHLREQLILYKKMSPLSPANIASNSRSYSPQQCLEAEIEKKKFALCQLKKQLKQQKEQK